MIENLLIQLKTDLISNFEEEELCIDRLASLGSVSFSILEKLLKESDKTNVLESMATALGTIRYHSSANLLQDLLSQDDLPATIRLEAISSLAYYPSSNLLTFFYKEKAQKIISNRCLASIAEQLWCYPLIDSKDLYVYLLSDQVQFYVNQFAKESLQFSLESHLGKNFSTHENIDWLKELSDCQGRSALNVIDKIILDIQSKDHWRRLSAIRRSGFFNHSILNQLLKKGLVDDHPEVRKLSALSLITNRSDHLVENILHYLTSENSFENLTQVTLALENIYDPKIADYSKKFFALGGNHTSAVSWPIAVYGWKYPSLLPVLDSILKKKSSNSICNMANSSKNFILRWKNG